MTDQPTTGGCLCGAIRYSIAASATPIYSVICHCVNCKKATGTHMVTTSIFLEPQFTLTSGTPKAYRDAATDSGTPVFRHFCGDCGSNLYITSPLLEEIRAVCSGTLDDATVKWRPNKGENAAISFLVIVLLLFLILRDVNALLTPLCLFV
ncbi:hypothetical protein DBV05_g1701 [Lasiodiplodia theobromae]|uniref:CENP-V/GFA domain-containing protein n=1 Tax=Lasiodiplodia theobromae TaxID=45133 RepID=A0A5N5DP48_9PEZI|nr:hypothetical protein DBV05_g1701 [Lasiodiplodia theobromae]